MEMTVAVVIVVAAFAILGLYYRSFVAKRGKAEGHTARTWCMPLGHGDIGQRTANGQELAPSDECPPVPAGGRSTGERPGLA